VKRKNRGAINEPRMSKVMKDRGTGPGSTTREKKIPKKANKQNNLRGERDRVLQALWGEIRTRTFLLKKTSSRQIEGGRQNGGRKRPEGTHNFGNEKKRIKSSGKKEDGPGLGPTAKSREVHQKKVGGAIFHRQKAERRGRDSVRQ